MAPDGRGCGVSANMHSEHASKEWNKQIERGEGVQSAQQGPHLAGTL